MKKMIFILLSLCSFSVLVSAQTPIAGAPGGYSRIGTDALSRSVGNATIALLDNYNSGFSNPAIPAFLQNNYIQASSFVLGLDRNIYSLYGQHKAGELAAISYGILFSKISAIDGRNSNGVHTENFQTNEATGLLNFSLKPKRTDFTIGISMKWRYANFFKKVPSTSAWGIDLGILYPLLDNKLFLAAAYQDLNSMYEWDTKNIYGDNGNTTTDYFPKRFRVGFSYLFSEYSIKWLGEFETWAYQTEPRSYQTTNSNFPTVEIIREEKKIYSGKYVRFGAIWSAIEKIDFSFGVDQIDLTYSENTPTYSFGFRYTETESRYQPNFNFAYTIEPKGPQNTWIISAGFQLP